VISNLVINARQAMPEGGVVAVEAANVVLEPEDGAEPRPGLSIVVRDQGCGIAPDVVDRIFEPYFSTKATGTGLGLAICYSVVSRHGGRLTVSSQVGVGTEFALELPACRAAAAAPPAAPAAIVPAAGARRILIMDDEENVRDLVARMLARSGYTAVGVADGEAAVAAYEEARAGEEGPFAAVIMDLTIPGGRGGAETIADLRAIDPDVRAIVASGYSHDPVLSEYAAHGFAARLVKPFDRATLVATVAEVVVGVPAGST